MSSNKEALEALVEIKALLKLQIYFYIQEIGAKGKGKAEMSDGRFLCFDASKNFDEFISFCDCAD